MWTDFDIFGRNVTDKVSNQKTLYLSTNLCFCTTWQNWETRKLHFPSNAVLVHCLNSTSCLISSIFLTHDSYAPVRLPKSCNAFSCREYWGHGSGERKSIALQQLAFVAHTMHQCAVSSGCPISQGNAEALDRWSGKTKHRLISYTFSVTLLSKIIIIGSRMWVCQDYSKSKVGRFYRQHCAQRKPPVFNLLRGRFWGFSPRRGDTLHRWRWNLAQDPLLRAKFLPHRYNDRGVRLQKLKFLLRFDQNVEYKRPAEAYPLFWE